MNSRDFAYWLQGFFEIGGVRAISVEEAQVIQNHLNLVFIHEIDPSFPAEQQDALNAAHNGKPLDKLPYFAQPVKPGEPRPRC